MNMLKENNLQKPMVFVLALFQTVLLYMAIISAVAYTIWGVLLKYNPVARVSVYGFMNPVFGVILSAFLLGEKNQAFGYKGLTALLLVCIRIFIVNKEPKAVKTDKKYEEYSINKVKNPAKSRIFYGVNR